MCWFGVIVYNETPSSMRKGRIPYLVFSCILLALFTISQITDGVVIFNLLANSSSSFEALVILKPKYDLHWWRIVSAAATWLCSWIGDGLLVGIEFHSTATTIIIIAILIPEPSCIGVT